MRSLTTKLTIAFLLIGILGAALVAVIITTTIRTEFNRLVLSQISTQISTELEAFYANTGDWHDAESLLIDYPRWGTFTLLDNDGTVIFTSSGQDDADFSISVPLEVSGEQIGTLRMQGNEERFAGRGAVDTLRGERVSPEEIFLNNVFRSSLVSAAVAAVVALVVGLLLSRGLTRPIRALTDATQKMAAGELGTQVVGVGNDEIGRLSAAFNQLSADLATASQKRRQLTADIAHDLRTPLSILRGYMEGIKDGSLQSTPQINAIMYEEVEHLEHLVADLRTLSLADTGELILNKRAVDPRALLERTGLAYVMQAEQRGLALRIDAVEGLPPVNVDAERMTQVLNNLVSNALRFTEQGEIVLGASSENGRINLCVSDTGSGMSQEDLPHIFDRFYRADSSRQREADGAVSSGLGLAIAQALVQAHGGRISVKSVSAEINPTHCGTQFTISLPNTIGGQTQI